MDSDRHHKSKRDKKEKDRKRKSRSKSSNSRSRSRSSSSDGGSYNRKKSPGRDKRNRDKPSTKPRDSREEMHHENMMPFHNYPMMYDKAKFPPGFDMGGPMMPMHRMPQFPGAFPMPGYPSMIRPPMYPQGVMPPLPNQMDMMKMNRMQMKPYPDHKAVAPSSKKEKEKSVKKEEESGKIVEFPPTLITAENFRSIHLSIKHIQEPLFLLTCKKILNDLDTKLRDKKLKTRAKEISEYVSNLYDKIKEAEKRDKKKSTPSSSSEAPKISELELMKALNEIQDIKMFLNIVNVEKFSLDNIWQSDIIDVRESEESSALFEEAKSLFASSKEIMS